MWQSDREGINKGKAKSFVFLICNCLLKVIVGTMYWEITACG